jgi:transitional endoplasmic reticulum ATPase
MQDFLTALREIEPTATREFFTERSTVKWHHIGGLDKIKETLVSIVEWPSKYPDLFAAGKVVPPRGILFSGPSGTGKTLMAKALAGETGLNFISISGPILFSKWLGESEKALHQIFKKAKQSAPCILFFDEIDALVFSRGSGSNEGATERMASQFFNELDNLSDHSQVIVLGATNREDLLDPALMRAGRLDYVLPFSSPNEKDRLEIFQVHAREKPLGEDVDLKELAKATEGMVGAQIAFICRSAAMMAIAESIQAPRKRPAAEFFIGARHFQEAIQRAQKIGELPKC